MMQTDSLYWYAIHTKPSQEERANSNLRGFKVETFAPKLREIRYKKNLGERTYVIKPLFPRYIFARFNANEMLHKIRFTRGVHKVVSFGGNPTPVDDEVITLIQSQMGTDKLVRIGGEIKYGDKVVIQDGPLKDFVAVFQYEMKDSDRVMLLLNTVNYQARIVIERELLKKVR